MAQPASTLGRNGTTVAVAAAGVWTVVMSFAAVWRHQQFLSHRFDLGNMAQAVWSTTQGRPLEMTDGVTGDQIVRLGAHVDPILAVIAPIWWLYPQPESLLILQAAVLSTGVYPAARLALKHTGSPLIAALIGGWYLLFPWIVWNALNDFHAVTLAIPLLLYAIWLLDEHRLGWFAIVASVALLTGELVGLTIGALGIWYALKFRRRRAGATIALAGFGWTILCLTVIVPAFNDGRSSRFYDRYETVGGSPAGLFRTLVSDPSVIFEQITTSTDLRYVALLLIPTALLALGTPLLLVAVAPQLALNLLSDFWSTNQPMFQYVAPITPVLIAASIMTIGRFNGRVRVAAALAPITAAASVLVLMPPIPGGQEFVFGATDSPARRSAMRRAISLVPADAAVTTTNRLGAHLSARQRVEMFPSAVHAEWAVIDLHDPWLAARGERRDPTAFRSLLLRFARWRLVFESDGVRVYRKSEL